MDRIIAFELGRICEEAALASAPFVGKGDGHAADEAATEAMRKAFDDIGISGTIVIGEGERDEAPMLYIGEKVGKDANGPHLEIAVDPLEGTNLCATGAPGAITVIAAAIEGEGKLLHAPDCYMDKIAVGENAAGSIDLDATPTENLKAISKKIGKEIEELTIVVMDRDRNEKLIAEIRKAGARIKLIGDGDVATALAAGKPGTGVDALMGIGAAPEGVITAAGMRALKGEIQGRLWFHKEEDRKRAIKMGADPEKKYKTEELAEGNVMFAATGVTGGDFLDGVKYSDHGVTTNTVVMRSRSNTIRWQRVEHRIK